MTWMSIEFVIDNIDSIKKLQYATKMAVPTSKNQKNETGWADPESRFRKNRQLKTRLAG
jgi:hypothetical protein